MESLVWVGIGLCISQSAVFSGLNLALFSISRLRLEVEASKNNQGALRVLALRKDYNFALTTILWGNVGVNVLLALLSNSVLAGVLAFLFSTVVITFFGEIIPQAYFSRHALRMASLLSPVLRFYQTALYLIAKPTAKILDLWLGPESIQFFAERDFEEVLRKHMESKDTDIGDTEGTGALNFLAIDDVVTSEEGEPLDPRSLVSIEISGGLPVFPEFGNSASDPFLARIQASGKKWVVLTNNGEPRLVLDADGFLRAAVFQGTQINPLSHCHRPLIVTNANIRLGEVLRQLSVESERPGDDVIDKDIVLVWQGTVKRIITGADILGRLMRGIVTQRNVSSATGVSKSTDENIAARLRTDTAT
jgi:metal transporter CNNM